MAMHKGLRGPVFWPPLLHEQNGETPPLTDYLTRGDKITIEEALYALSTTAIYVAKEDA